MVDRLQVTRFRVQAEQLDRTDGGLGDTVVLDIGVQDTGPDGALWALAVRGVDVAALAERDLVLLWTVRGAPHLYRRADVAQVAAAVEPYSDADAGKRIFDAAKPLKAAGIGNVEALNEVADQMRRPCCPLRRWPGSTPTTRLSTPRSRPPRSGISASWARIPNTPAAVGATRL